MVLPKVLASRFARQRPRPRPRRRHQGLFFLRIRHLRPWLALRAPQVRLRRRRSWRFPYTGLASRKPRPTLRYRASATPPLAFKRWASPHVPLATPTPAPPSWTTPLITMPGGSALAPSRSTSLAASYSSPLQGWRTSTSRGNGSRARTSPSSTSPSRCPCSMRTTKARRHLGRAALTSRPPRLHACPPRCLLMP